jgi:HlyD family secretion protein
MSPELAVIPTSFRGPGRAVAVVLAVVTTLLLLWGALAPINSGAVATGEVLPEGRTKIIQHLEGGIIRVISVKDGDKVVEGQELMRLEDTDAKAQLAIVSADEAAQAALVARLVAERDGTPLPQLKPGSSSVATQIRLFDARRQALHKEMDGLNSRIRAAVSERDSWSTKSTHLKAMSAYAEEESQLNQGLYEKNFISRPRLLQLNSRKSETSANLAESDAEAARAQQKVTDGETAISKLKGDWLTSVLEELRKAQDAHDAAREKLQVAQDRLARTRIAAPLDGRVNGLRYSTIGGVVPSGGAIMEVTPSTEHLLVEARLLPDDIEAVHVGLPARVRLSAYKTRWHFALKGKVSSVSPDTFKDEKAGRSYYKVQVEIPDTELDARDKTILVPGMLAQVEIVTGERTALRYLLDPVIDSFGRAMKEK